MAGIYWQTLSIKLSYLELKILHAYSYVQYTNLYLYSYITSRIIGETDATLTQWLTIHTWILPTYQILLMTAGLLHIFTGAWKLRRTSTISYGNLWRKSEVYLLNSRCPRRGQNSSSSWTQKKMAQRRDWNIANIGVDALWNPDKLVGSIGHEGKYEGTERTTQVGLKGYVMRA